MGRAEGAALAMDPCPYAGKHGGCMACDSLAFELMIRGHRKGCRSEYASEPPLPMARVAQMARAAASDLEARVSLLRQQADRLDRGDDAARTEVEVTMRGARF